MVKKKKKEILSGRMSIKKIKPFKRATIKLKPTARNILGG